MAEVRENLREIGCPGRDEVDTGLICAVRSACLRAGACGLAVVIFGRHLTENVVNGGLRASGGEFSAVSLT